MSSMDTVARRIARYRVCLERDAQRGAVTAAAQAAIDGGMAALGGVLESARIELEGAGAAASARGMGDPLVCGCATLALGLFHAARRGTDAALLARRVETAHRESGRLLDQLRRQLESAA